MIESEKLKRECVKRECVKLDVAGDMKEKVCNGITTTSKGLESYGQKKARKTL